MKEKLNIIKVGGKIVENPAALSRLISQFAQLPGLKMLVHGGGRTATDIGEQIYQMMSTDLGPDYAPTETENP